MSPPGRRAPHLYHTEIRVLGAVVALCGLLLAVLIVQTLGAILMKRVTNLAACAAAALALTGCGTAMPDAANAKAALGTADATDKLEVLKEVNRHIELCRRTYAWPFSVFIDCAPTPPPTLTVEQIADIAVKAAAKAIEAFTAPNT